MDLDAMDVSKARCYNCNKIGHLSKDCPSPRKIKYKSDKGRSKGALNLINLDIPEGPEDGTINHLSLDAMDGPSGGKDLFDPTQYFNRNLEQIKNNMEKSFDNSITRINSELWKSIIREAESHAICKQLESQLNPYARHFIPGNRRVKTQLHGGAQFSIKKKTIDHGLGPLCSKTVR